MQTRPSTPRARPAGQPMDLMRPSVAFAIPSAANAAGPRRWLRLMLVALGSVIALLPVLGAAAPPALRGTFPRAS